MPLKELEPILNRLANATENVDQLTIDAARAALQLTNGYVKRAAQALGWYRMRLQRLMKEHPELDAEASTLREKIGWNGGRPPHVVQGTIGKI